MIGNVVATLLLTFVLWIGYQSTRPEHSRPGPSLPPPISVGKERFTGRTRDASTFTQTVRRKAVVSGHYGDPTRFLHETNHTSGFTNGVVELYSLSGLCEAACKVAATAACEIYDGGNANSEYPNILDGGTSADVYDGGDAFTTNTRTLNGNGYHGMDGGTAYINNSVRYDGGNAFTLNSDILDGNGYYTMDGGSAYFTLLNHILLNGGDSGTIVCQPSNNVS